MRRLAAVVVLTLAVAGLVWWLSPSRDKARTPSTAPSGEAVAARERPVGEMSPPPPPPEALRAERTPLTAEAEPPPTAETPTLLAFSGRAVEAREGAPVAGIAIEIGGAGGEKCAVVTDKEGRFRTPAVFREGVATLRHRPDPEHPRFQVEHGIEPRQILVPPVDPKTGRPIEEVLLRVSSPDSILVVEVFEPAGGPAPDARVLLLLYRVGEPRCPASLPVARTDEKGLARFGMSRPEGAPPPKVFADDAERNLVSDLVEIPPEFHPTPEAPVRLHLLEGGRLRVRVLDEAGRLVPNSRVDLLWRVLCNFFGDTWEDWRTGQDGEVLFRGLAPGTHRLSVRDPRNYFHHDRTVEIERGVESLVEVTLEPATVELAASGKTLDEQGAPLAQVFVWIEDDEGDLLKGIRTDDEGRFEFWLRPLPRVTVKLGAVFPEAEFDADPFEPPEARVPFGTRDLVFRRAAVLPKPEVSFRVLDARTEAGIEGAEIWLHDTLLDESRRRGTTGPDGSARVAFKAKEGLLWGVSAFGYLDREGPVSEIALDDPAPRVEVRLERGFERRYRIYDGFSGDPLPGAVVRDGATGELLATANEDGRVHLRGYAPSENLEISHRRYRTAIWPTARRNAWRDDGIPLTTEKDR